MNNEIHIIRDRIQIAKSIINQKDLTQVLNELIIYLENKNKTKCFEIVEKLRLIRIENDETNFFIKSRLLYIITNYIYSYFVPDDNTHCWEYNKSNVEKFKYNKDLNKNSVTITMCSCKRNHLLKRTIDSILECITDLNEYVYEWIIIDDNSSKKDREEIKNLYPFIRIIEKDMSQKGHIKSMNIFLDIVKTPFMFNIEDDWEFFVKKPYINEMLKILNYDSNYGQCLINANYTEDLVHGANIWMTNVNYPENKNENTYLTHWHNPYKFLCDQIHEEINKRKQQSELYNYLYTFSFQLYWPDYSLRPGLTRMEVFKTVGKYDENTQHFEMNFAYRYFEKGWRTSFLFGTFSKHIGKKTWESNEQVKNAYNLNNENQFN